MTASDADRAKAAELACCGDCWQTPEANVDAVAAALASERAAAVADLRARVLALAEEYEVNGRVRETLGRPAWPLDVTARLRAAVTDTTGGTQ